MAFSMSGIEDGYSYNRFDLYEKKSKDCECDHKKSKGGYMAAEKDEDDADGGAISEGMMDDDKSGTEYKDGGGIMGAGEANQVGDGIAAKAGAPKVKKKDESKNAGRAAAAKAKDPLERQREMNKAGRKGVDRIGVAIKQVQGKKDDGKKGDAAAERRKKLQAKFGKNMRKEDTLLDAYSSIYEKMDPVGKEDGDVDNDGDKDSSDKYLLNRRKAIAKAMKKEEAELEIFTEKELDVLEEMLGKTDALVEADMKDAPSIKDAKPAKKTDVKYYKGLGIAPTIKKEELSIDDQMRISREAAKGRNPNPDHKAIRGKMLKKPLPKDNRTDAQKMTDAVGKPRMGSSD